MSYELIPASVLTLIILLLDVSLFKSNVQESMTQAGGVPQGAKTSEYYRTNNIPNRFENPGMNNGIDFCLMNC